MYGHVEKLAEEIKKGASSIEGVEAKLWQVCGHQLDHIHISYVTGVKDAKIVSSVIFDVYY